MVVLERNISDLERAKFIDDPDLGETVKTLSKIANADALYSVKPLVRVINVPFADTEVAQVLSNKTKRFLIRVRDYTSALKIAFVVNESSTNFIGIPRGCSFSEEAISFTGTLYFQTNKASQIVEILEWSTP